MSTLQTRSACGLACLALMASNGAQADEFADATTPNADMRYVAASVQRDARQDQAVIGLLSLPVADRAWVQLGGGQTRQTQGSAAQRTSVALAGAGYIGNRWQASLAANHRDAGSRLRQTDWDGLLEWQGEQFDLGLDGHYRNARLAGTVASPTAPPGAPGVPVTQRITGSGIGIHGSVRLTESFAIHAAAMHFNYRVSTQQNGAGAGGGTSLLSSALMQAHPSFVSREEVALNRSSKLGASYRFDTVTVTGEFLADRVLDEPGTVRTLQLKAALRLPPQWIVTPTLGRTHGKTHGGVVFGGLSVSSGW